MHIQLLICFKYYISYFNLLICKVKYFFFPVHLENWPFPIETAGHVDKFVKWQRLVRINYGLDY